MWFVDRVLNGSYWCIVMLLWIELAGWSIIILELIGQKGRFESALDVVHGGAVKVSSAVVSWGWRHKYWFGGGCILLINVVAFYQPEIWDAARHLHPKITPFFDMMPLGGDRQNSLFLAMLGFVVGMIVLLPALGALKLMSLHPSGVLSGIGVMLALGSSVLSRLI